MSGLYTGENIPAAVESVIQQYDLREKLGYFVLDNASNNDTAMEHIQKPTASREIHAYGASGTSST